MSTAHYFTFLRIVIGPLFPIFYLGYQWMNIPLTILPFILLFLLLVCEFTDLFDGFVARKKNEVTDLGKVLDPLADSVTRSSIFLTFTQPMISVSLLLVLVFLYRDFFINALRMTCAFKGIALAARTSGKIKAILQGSVNFFIVILMIFYAFGHVSLATLQRSATIAISIAAIYTVASAVDYLYANRKFIKKAVRVSS